LRVLLVEDEMMIALLLESMLAELGHAIAGPVGPLDAAVDVARREAVDLAILDVNINGGEVYPVANVLATRRIPFIFATGYGRAGLRAPYRNRPTLQKPYLIPDLEKAISEACRA
jgi:CheY-like chemotaxis protein